MNKAVHFNVGLGVAVLVLASSLGAAGVEGLDGQKPVQPSISTAKILESLGPGPLGPRWDAIERSPVKVDNLEDAIDQCVEANMSRLNAPGAAVAVILDGELLYESGYGVKRRNLSSAVDADTIFRIGSVTKQMTAAALMQQVELGRVDLDAPVTDYIPELVLGGRWPADRITVRHTLTHTTGFPDHINDVTTVGDQALSQWAAGQEEIELHAPPGSFWNYSNPNFMIAGLVAERASGTPYRDLFKESLWQPAGMHSTTFDPEEVIDSDNYAIGHYYDSETHREYAMGPRDNDLWAAGPAGFAFSTVGDLAHWALLLTDGGGPALSPWSAATMQDPHVWANFTPDLYYGFGVMIESYQNLDVRQHGGNIAGFGTYLLWVPERRFVVALLTNVTSSLTSAAYCIVDEVLDPVTVPDPDLTTDPSTWRGYTGEYVMTETDGTRFDARVYLDGVHLMADAADPSQPGVTFTTELEQVFLDTFLFDSDGDGAAETDVTFCSRTGDPGFMMWLRNRHAVGERKLIPRRGARTVSP